MVLVISLVFDGYVEYLSWDGGSQIGLEEILGCGFSGVFVVYSWKDRGSLEVREKEGSLRERERERE